ncbi:MAG: RNA-binding S4 domain-containing protein [Flavobacteriales bacterium]|jgi:ribosome-associated protein|tara:strand:- start:119 stop:331 length:213 start_codon:yes stop_codon:yes gene_type:complete
MQELDFNLDKEFIELNKLLKILALVESGGQANAIISEGHVRYNGEVDTRKRLKLRKGDLVEFDETRIRIS